jgi:hypothetical protein
MSLKVIELNDSAITVGDESGIIVQSPGFALATDNSLELGEAAEQQARLHPTNSYNKYWHELSMEPLSHGNSIRHFADIAYAQLMHLAKIGEIDADVIFAVPGNFTRQQLAILLGLSKQSPFTPVGVVDSALVAAIAKARTSSVIYADIQLHQVLLTKLVIAGDQLKSESVIQVPGVGNQNFMDLMMQLATGLFIQQCRFNPQHDAESEQQLYNELPNWLKQDDGNKNSLLLELKTGSAVHTAKMPRESLINHLGGYYEKIHKQIAALTGSDETDLLISSAMAALPGFISTLGDIGNLHILNPQTINSACLDYKEHILSGEGGIHLVSALPVAARTAVNSNGAAADLSTAQTLEVQSPQVQVPAVPAPEISTAEARAPLAGEPLADYVMPTHVLYGDRAVSIAGHGSIDIQNKLHLNGATVAANSIVLSLSELPDGLGSITASEGAVWFDGGSLEFLLNQSRVSGRQRLRLGDRIAFAERSEEIRLIQLV